MRKVWWVSLTLCRLTHQRLLPCVFKRIFHLSFNLPYEFDLFKNLSHTHKIDHIYWDDFSIKWNEKQYDLSFLIMVACWVPQFVDTKWVLHNRDKEIRNADKQTCYQNVSLFVYEVERIEFFNLFNSNLANKYQANSYQYCKICVIEFPYS